MSYDTSEYFRIYGHDIEMEERGKQQAFKQEMQDWILSAASVLCQCFDNIAENAQSLAPNDNEIRRLAEETAVYYMLLGADKGTVWNKECTSDIYMTVSTCSYLPYKQLFEIFLKNREVNCTFEGAQESVRLHSPLFRSAGYLAKDSYGSFWTHLLDALPNYDGYDHRPDELDSILDCLGQCYALFHGDIDENDYALQLWDTLEIHWQTKCICHPNAVSADEAVRNWDVQDGPCPIRNLLVAHFPEITRMWKVEELAELDGSSILGELYPKYPGLTVNMWQLILNTAEDSLSDPNVAREMILYTMEQVWNSDHSLFHIVTAMKNDEHFVQQVFHSAYVGFPQKKILDTCDEYYEQKLKAYLLELLEDNPNFEGFD